MSLSSASFATSRRLDTRKPTEFEKNFSSLEFEVRQLALQLQLEKKALKETEKLTAEKEKEIEQVEDKISAKDVEIRRLHKQFRQNRETCESLKKTAGIFQEQVAGMEKVLAEEKKKTETRRTELQGHVAKYEQLWVQYQLRYESSKLAQDVKKCKEITQQCEEEVHSLDMEHNELNTQITAIQPSLSMNKWVIQIAEVRCETDCIISEMKATCQSIKQKKNELQRKKQAEEQNQIQCSEGTCGQVMTEQQQTILMVTTNNRQTSTSHDAYKQKDLNSEVATHLPPPRPAKKLSASFQLFIPRLQSPHVTNKGQTLSVAPTLFPATHVEVPRHESQMPQQPRTPIASGQNQDVASCPMHTEEDTHDLEEMQSMVVAGVSQSETERENLNEMNERESHHTDNETQDCGTSSRALPSQQPTQIDTEDADFNLFKRPLEPTRRFIADSPISFSYESRPMFTPIGSDSMSTHSQSREGGGESVTSTITQEVQRPNTHPTLWMTPDINPTISSLLTSPPQPETGSVSSGFFSFSTPQVPQTQDQLNTETIDFSSHSFLSQESPQSTFSLGSLFGGNSPASQPMDTTTQTQEFSLNMMGGGDSDTRGGLSSLF